MSHRSWPSRNDSPPDSPPNERKLPQRDCESEVKTEPTKEIISGNVKCEIDEEGQGSNFDFQNFYFWRKNYSI